MPQCIRFVYCWHQSVLCAFNDSFTTGAYNHCFLFTDPGMAMDMELSITGPEPGKIDHTLYCHVMNLEEPLHLHVQAEFKVITLHIIGSYSIFHLLLFFFFWNFYLHKPDSHRSMSLLAYNVIQFLYKVFWR